MPIIIIEAYAEFTHIIQNMFMTYRTDIIDDLVTNIFEEIFARKSCKLKLVSAKVIPQFSE